MATDRLEPAGVYFGTSTGTLFASTDEGDRWNVIAQYLPAIRRHINVFVDGERATLEMRLAAGAEMMIITAISGG